MVFVNRIASVIHSCVNEFFGNPNKNIGAELSTSKRTYLIIFAQFCTQFCTQFMMPLESWVFFQAEILVFEKYGFTITGHGMAISTEVKHFCSPGDFRITARRSVGPSCRFKANRLRIWYEDDQDDQDHNTMLLISLDSDSLCLLQICIVRKHVLQYSAECRGRRSWQICLCFPSSRSLSFPQWSWACKCYDFNWCYLPTTSMTGVMIVMVGLTLIPDGKQFSCQGSDQQIPPVGRVPKSSEAREEVQKNSAACYGANWTCLKFR